MISACADRIGFIIIFCTMIELLHSISAGKRKTKLLFITKNRKFSCELYAHAQFLCSLAKFCKSGCAPAVQLHTFYARLLVFDETLAQPHFASDSVTRVNDATRVTICGNSNSTLVTLRKILTRLESVTFFTEWLDSSHSPWLETRVRVIFTICLSTWWTNLVRLHAKKWAFYASVMTKIGWNFLFCLSSCAMLHFKDHVSPTCVEVDLRHCCHWGVSRAQYIDTLLWLNAVFANRDPGSGPHTVILGLFQIPAKWLKFSRFKSKPKTVLQNIMLCWTHFLCWFKCVQPPE